MFYCAECAKKNNWPESFGQSYGSCEVCKKAALCNDVSASDLPLRVTGPAHNPSDSGNK